MTERDQPTQPAVARLLDQYRQRRHAWLTQADELLRLRDEARLAAEREALEIVTAARRDVRRIVVQARRELLVLTAQLHAAVESVDQASLEAPSEEAIESAARRELADNASLGTTRELVMGARREVRSVLDEARAEIEALAAEVVAPRSEPAALTAAPVPEPPIPTLDAILGADPRASQAAAPSAAARTDGASIHVTGQPSWLPTIETSPIASLGAPSPAAPMPVEDAVSRLGIDDALAPFASFPETESEDAADIPSSAAGEIGPVAASDSPRGFLGNFDERRQSRPVWLWVGLFAGAGALALAGTGWWFATRETSGMAAPAPATTPSVEDGPGAPGPTADVGPAAPAAVVSASPSVLAIEVRRNAWIRTIVDGHEDSRVYQAGESRQIVGANAVSIRSGDAGAVFVSLDGRPAEPLGSSGQVVTKLFSLASDSRATPAVEARPSSAVVAAPDAVAARPPMAAIQNANAGLPIAPPPPAISTAASAATEPASPAAAPVPPAAGPEAAPAAPAGNDRADLVAAGQQWLDAYQRRDQDAMAAAGTENMSVSDERSLTERFPAWQVGVRRDLDQVELQLTGDTALLTGRMTERSGDGATTSAQHVSRVSQIWVRRSGQWRLADVRIIAEARLNQVVR